MRSSQARPRRVRRPKPTITGTDYLAERAPGDPFGLTYAQRLRSDLEEMGVRIEVEDA